MKHGPNLKAGGFTNGLWRLEERSLTATARILARSEHGATLDLLKLNGCTEEALMKLVAAGRATTRVLRYRNPPGLTVRWFWPVN
jgi:hypothetical protein